MTTEALSTGSAHGVSCNKCGALSLEPQWSEEFSEEGIVLSLWRCSNCDHAFETEIPVGAGAEAEDAEETAPSLLVA